MRIFVAGATGAIGQRLVPQLVHAGHAVTGTTTAPIKLDLVNSLGAEGVVMDGLDASSVGQAVARAEPDVVVHQMTALAGGMDFRHFDRFFARTNQLRTTGTRNLIGAAAAAGTKRLVVQSYAGWPNAGNAAGLQRESDNLDHNPLKAQRESLAAIRRLDDLAADAPIDAVVLRYGSLYGPRASDELVDTVRRRRLPIIGRGTGVWSWLHVDDAAAATVAAIDGGAPGVYNVVDDHPAPVADWLPHLARVVGAKSPRHVPAWLGRIVAGEVVVSMMTKIRGSSNAKAKGELGWTPRWADWRDGFADAFGTTP